MRLQDLLTNFVTLRTPLWFEHQQKAQGSSEEGLTRHIFKGALSTYLPGIINQRYLARLRQHDGKIAKLGRSKHPSHTFGTEWSLDVNIAYLFTFP